MSGSGYNGKPPTGVTNMAVLEALQRAGEPVGVKDIGRRIGSDMKIERNLKAVSNACGYLLRNGLAHRVDQGIYQAGPGPQRGSEMTMTDIPLNGVMNPPTAASEPEQMHCDICGKPVASEMGKKAHMTRSHPKGLSADEAFERTGQALEILFPNGIPMSRLIELADLQKQMLRVLK